MPMIEAAAFVQITTTTAARDDAERIARALVERKLAACVQIDGPITSYYRWQGAVQRDEEWRCTVKTRSELGARVYELVRELHPYEIPEILTTPILAGSETYLRWLTGSTGQET